MMPYTEKIIIFPEKIQENSATPAADHLFKVKNKKEAKELPEEQAALSTKQQHNCCF